MDTDFRDYILDHLSDVGEFETKNMFGGTAVLKNGVAFGKIKHGSFWLKVDEKNIMDFLEKSMVQYTYGKDNSRRLNFYETPAEVLEDRKVLGVWAAKSCEAATRSKKK